jgi:CPA2 family monovalent cation:H+ antiporter-2
MDAHAFLAALAVVLGVAAVTTVVFQRLHQPVVLGYILAGFTALLQSSLMVWLGFVVGRLFGWTPVESLFTGAIIAISSTTIIAKAFDEQGVHGRLRELVVGC